MALITCPECGKQVSSFAKSCPNCGYPINENLLLKSETSNSKEKEKELVEQLRAKKKLSLKDYLYLVDNDLLDDDDDKAWAYFQIGCRYDNGEEVDADYKKSIEYFEKSLDYSKKYALGGLFARYIALWEYEKVFQMIEDERYLSDTVKDETSHAIYRLALRCRDGSEGMHKDFKKYMELTKRACDTSLSCGYWYVEYSNRLMYLAGNASKKEFNDNYDEAFNYLERGLSKEPCDKEIHARLYNILGVLFGDHHYSRFSPEIAANYYLKAIDMGNMSARDNYRVLSSQYRIKGKSRGNILSVQIIGEQSVSSNKSRVVRGVVGGLLFGGLGAIGGLLIPKTNNYYTFLVIYDDGRRETIQTLYGSKEFNELISYIQ